MTKLPLAGIRVIDFSHAVAGPHGTLWLASLGADVIKIEGPTRPDSFRGTGPAQGGSGNSLNLSAIFLVTNLGKRSCAIDITGETGQSLIKDLVRRSDIVLANFRPGVLERFKLGYEDLREVKPDLIMATLTGYGGDGPLARYAAFAPNIHAFGGLSEATGYLGGPPAQIFQTFADTLAGQAAVLPILAALRHRARTGEGQYIDSAMGEIQAALAPGPSLHYSATGQELERQANRDERMAPHGCYPCDGRERWIAIAAEDDDQWQAAAEVLGHREWLDDHRFSGIEGRLANQDELDALIWEATSGWDSRELADRLQAAGVAATTSNNAQDLLADVQLEARGFFEEVMHEEAGPARLPQLPWRLSNADRQPLQPGPNFADSTEDVLRDVLELSGERIAELQQAGVVLQAAPKRGVSFGQPCRSPARMSGNRRLITNHRRKGSAT